MWETERLKEYLVQGFTLDDERLKQRLTTLCVIPTIVRIDLTE
ncbi:MAG: hypothetical protein WAV76_10625 [Bacteroidota bacterium]